MGQYIWDIIHPNPSKWKGGIKLVHRCVMAIVSECIAAGYRGFEYVQIGTKADEFNAPIAGTGRLAPAVVDHLCVVAYVRREATDSMSKKRARSVSLALGSRLGRERRIASSQDLIGSDAVKNRTHE